MERMTHINTIPEYSWVHDRYVVTESGHVINLKTGREINPYNQGCSRGQIWLYGKKAKKKAYRYRLVAGAFVPNPLNKPDINHLDEDASNDDFRNLEWCTKGENNRYGTRIRRIAENKRRLIVGVFSGERVVFTRQQIETMYGKTAPVLRCCNAKEEKFKRYRGVVWDFL